VRELETSLEESNDKFNRHSESSGDNEKILKNEITALKKNIEVLEQNLSD
jgi:hemoglobin-like flavoprotein